MPPVDVLCAFTGTFPITDPDRLRDRVLQPTEDFKHEGLQTLAH